VTSVVNRYYDPTTDQFLSIDPLVGQTGQPYVFTNDDPLNATDTLGTAEVALSGGGIPTPQEQQDVTIGLEDDALTTLGVSQSGIELIDKILQQQLNPFTEEYASEEMDTVLSDIEKLKDLNTILTGIQIAGFSIEDIQEGHGIGYALGDATFDGAGMVGGSFVLEDSCGAFIEAPPALVVCGIVGGVIGLHAGHYVWQLLWKALHGK
jgi:hypothetical protein